MTEKLLYIHTMILKKLMSYEFLFYIKNSNYFLTPCKRSLKKKSSETSICYRVESEPLIKLKLSVITFYHIHYQPSRPNPIFSQIFNFAQISVFFTYLFDETVHVKGSAHYKICRDSKMRAVQNGLVQTFSDHG
jgi:hypothetical protein